MDVPADVGRNTITIEQMPAGATVAPEQVSLTIALTLGPDSDAVPMRREDEPVLVTVAVCWAAPPTVTDPNARGDGVIVKVVLGTSPVPESVAVTIPAPASVVTSSLADLGPPVVGENRTVTSQPSVGARRWPAQPSETTENDGPPSPPIDVVERLAGAPPMLRRWTTLSTAEPVVTGPKSSSFGTAVTFAAADGAPQRPNARSAAAGVPSPVAKS